jgi:hypothetical protein
MMRQSVGVRVDNPITWFRDEFRRENAEARERRTERRSMPFEHPVLYAAFLTVFWGSSMWLVDGRPTDFASLLGLAVAAAVFGLGMLWWARRWNRKQRNANAQSAGNGG